MIKPTALYIAMRLLFDIAIRLLLGIAIRFLFVFGIALRLLFDLALRLLFDLDIRLLSLLFLLFTGSHTCRVETGHSSAQHPRHQKAAQGSPQGSRGSYGERCPDH